MMWFYILGTLLLFFFLMKNIHSDREFKQYSQEAITVYHDPRKTHKIARVFFKILFVLSIALLIVGVFVWHIQDPSSILSLICLSIGCFLFAFYPFTPGRWVLTARGIYIYNSGIFIPWTQMIGTEILPRGKQTYIILNIKQTEKEHGKRTAYPILVPGTQARDLCNMIREFITVMDRKQHRKQFNAERAVPLKDRKFY
ncbi:MAG: hypothetical protein IJN87_09370 [Firmicutes bacterium]|nr:hypothetical protein [Bacillota bacterium]